MNNSRLLTLLILGVAGAGTVVLAAAGLAWGREDLAFLACLAALTIASELVDFGPMKNSRISVSIIVIFAAGTVTGLPGASFIACTTAVIDAVLHRKALRKSAFNFGVLVLTGAAYVGTLEAFSPAIDSDSDWLAMLGPAMAGAAIGFAVNSGLVAAAISLDRGLRLMEVWSSQFGWVFPFYVLTGALSVLMALSYDRWEVTGLALFIVPIVMVWLAMRTYVDGASLRAGRGASSAT